ncbi:MAG TPA: LAGLIDADG family homing endonuclease [Candidatus Limnocylindria bacterium]|nr:LAGLIDADG family homing endonuclease [Candidatus Limnocylindria bacterium]
MPPGEGKGWAKGRTAQDDPRVAHAASAHRGMQYVAHLPPEQDPRRKSAPAVVEWQPKFAYVMGLLATDGAIVRGRTITFPSADRELVEHVLHCLGKANTISAVRTKTGATAYRTQIGDVALCRWLPTIGITARKSLVLGAVEVPDALLADLLRGLLDGDGSIINKRARADTGRTRSYYWEYLRTSFLSASRAHIVWLRERIDVAFGLQGYIATARARDGHHEMYTLRFGKRGSLELLPRIYADPAAPRLTRKWRVWADYVERHSRDSPLGRM